MQTFPLNVPIDHAKLFTFICVLKHINIMNYIIVDFLCENEFLLWIFRIDTKWEKKRLLYEHDKSIDYFYISQPNQRWIEWRSKETRNWNELDCKLSGTVLKFNPIFFPLPVRRQF